jgi:hypothetical protein
MKLRTSEPSLSTFHSFKARASVRSSEMAAAWLRYLKPASFGAEKNPSSPDW